MAEGQLAAILFDLGDVIMREETEEKRDGVTQRAELVPGMAALLRDLRGAGKRLGLVADTLEDLLTGLVGLLAERAAERRR